MRDAATNSLLNLVLIRLHRSVLQYAGECWPWTSIDEATEEGEIQKLIEKQKHSVRQLAELLFVRGWNIDFGTFADLSELHYVALDYLLEQLIADQRRLVTELERAMPGCAADLEASALLTAITVSERDSLAKLQALASRRRTPAMVA